MTDLPMIRRARSPCRRRPGRNRVPASPATRRTRCVEPARTPFVASGVLLGAALVLAAISGGCATITPETGEGGEALELDPVSAERARVTTGIKAALLSETEVDAAAIGVRLVDETVRLEGFVDSEAERERALAIARESAPEREIVDQLEVR